MSLDNKKIRQADLRGSKGKGGGGSTFREDENTLQSVQTVKSLFAVGEGQMGGLVNGARSIYINDTPLQNADGSYNFGGKVQWDQRVGLPSQDYMAGFPSAAAEFGVGVEVTAAASQTRETSSTDVDAVRVTIGLPNGLYEQLTNENRLTGGVVQLAIDKKLSTSGTWITDRTVKIDGKTTSAYAESHLIQRPEGEGKWQVRLTRITADSASATLKNNTFWNSYTEIQDVKLEYPDLAYVGVAVSAKDLGQQQVPTVSFEVYGNLVRIPSNYDPVARTYDGVWDGEFKMGWTDNPAWILFDLITHPRYGLARNGQITDERVDADSFYAAAVYNDGLVDDGNGGTEPRFRCNAPIQAREDALRVCQNLASCMHAKMVWMGGQIAVVQDRPASGVRLISNSNVIDGFFDYVGSALPDRTTAINVTWNDPDDSYLQRISTVDASTEAGAFQTALTAAQDKYGYNTKDVAGFGITSESQARREGRWYLDSVLNQTEFAKFSMSLNGFDLTVGDVVTLFDANYAGEQQAGRLISGSTATSIKLDRPVTLSAGSVIDIQYPTGIETRTITEASGTLSTVTVSPALPSAPAEYTEFIITTAIAPRQFRISKLSQSKKNIVDVEALLYDPSKYARVETGVTLTSPVFTEVQAKVPSAPVGPITFRETAFYVDNAIKRVLHVGWRAPSNGSVIGYRVDYRQNLGQWQTSQVETNGAEIDFVADGTFEVRVFTVNHLGLLSGALSGSYTVDVSEEDGSLLNAPTNLQLVGGGTTFGGQDIHLQFTNPSANGSVTATVKDFVIEVIDPDTDTVEATRYETAVAAGSTRKHLFSYSANVAAFGGAGKRTVKFKVYLRDTNNKRSDPATATFTNPAPALLNNLAVVGGVQTVMVTFDKPIETDYKGVLIWADTTSTFTPSASNLKFDGDTNFVSLTGFTEGTTYYFKTAAYDTFGKDYTGTGLNVSGSVSAVASEIPGIPNGASLPGTGTEGDLFYNTTDGKLYRYHGGAWTAAVPAVDITGQLTDAQLAAIAAAKVTGQLVASQIADASLTTAKFAAGLRPIEVVSALPDIPHVEGRMVFLTTDDKVYRNTGSDWVASVAAADITGTVTDAQIAGLSASKVTGQLTDAQLAAISAAKLTGQITNTQITNDAITTPKIAAGAVTSNEIAANTIVAGNVAAGAITSTHLATGSVTAAAIAAGAVQAGEIASGAVTTDKLSALAVTSDKLAANSVIAGKIQAGAISATELAVNAITASKIVVTNLDSVFPDPGWYDANWWTNGVGAPTNVFAQESASWPVKRVLRFSGNVGTVDFSTTPFPVELGATYRYKVTIYVDINFNGMFGVHAHWPNQSWFEMGIPRSGTVASSGLSAVNISRNSWQSFTSTFTNAPGLAGGIYPNYSQLRFSTSGQTAGNVYVAVEMVRAASGDLIVDGAITTQKLAAGSVTSNEIAAGTITAGNIAASTITGTQIASNTITASKIAAGAITSSELAANSVIAGKIAASVITSAEIAAGTITAANIATGTITATQIAGSTITGSKLAAGTITATNIATGTITATQIAANAIGTSELSAGAVTATKIATGTITATQIAAGAITASEISANAINTTNVIGAAISSVYTGSTAVNGGTVTLTINVPASASGVVVHASSGFAYSGGGEAPSSYFALPVSISYNGSVVTTGRAAALYSTTSPGTGNITVSATRSALGGYGPVSDLYLAVTVAKR